MNFEAKVNMSETSGGERDFGVPKELASLVPSFDPATDNVEIWTSKVELLVTTWPASKLSELATRLILNCKGTAYQKLQLNRKELLVNDPAGIKKLVELVGGTWGQIPLEKKFELAEKALYRGSQKSDESSESYLSRCDVVWSELLAKQVSLQEMQAYIVLRGSKLSSEDKKRVIVESKAEKGGELKMNEVSAAIRMLGSGFFQEYTGARRDKGQKTYDHTAFAAEDEPEIEGEVFFSHEDVAEDDILETLAAENDEDAIMVMQFEDSISETIQNDSELSAYYSTYQEARRRLNERVKVRGFWPVRRFEKGKNKNKGKSKGKGLFSGPGALARRIANSFCRICLQKGHWKNECPQRSSQPSGSQSSAAATSAPTSFVVVEDTVPTEIAHMAIAEDQDFQRPKKWGNQVNGISNWGKWDKWGFMQRFQTNLKHAVRKMMPSDPRKIAPINARQQKPAVIASPEEPMTVPNTCDALFATTGSIGIVDLGASQTVVGDHQIGEILQSLPEQIRERVKRTTCNLTFRFGNQQTLCSRHAILLPLGETFFRIAIVPGKTPFLLSSSFLKGIGAVIDTEEGTMWSKKLQKQLVVEQTSKNLFMMDINQLWKPEPQEQQVQNSYVAGLIQSSESCPKEQPRDHSSVDSESTQVKGSQVSECQVSEQGTSDAFPSVMSTVKSVATCAQELKSCPPAVPSVPSLSDGVSVAATGQVPRVAEEVRPGNRPGEDRGHELRPTGQAEDCLWKGKTEPGISKGVRGSLMDGLVRDHIREEPEARTPNVHQVCGETSDSGNSEDSAHQCQLQEDVQDRSSEPDSNRVGSLGSFVRTRDNAGVRDSRSHEGAANGGTDGLHADREQEHVRPCSPDRDAHDGGPPTSSRVECEGRAVESAANAQECEVSRPDLDFEFLGPYDSQGYHAMIKKYVHQFSKELSKVQAACQTVKRHGPRLDLLEVMCSEQSELTKQVQRLGGKAQRFGKVQGDLKTTEGRNRLFNVMVAHRPRHLWYSPECGPWCQWSNMNMSKSVTACEAILTKRREQIWQVALGIVLFRFQEENKAHFDMEQPRGSALWKTPGMSEIRENTLWNEFDMCRIGDLRDPQTQEPIRKRMTVCSTSVDLHLALHGKLCSGEHHHRPIAGNTHVDGHCVKLSQWTELYPQKFARQVAKVLIHESSNPQLSFAGDVDEHPTKKRRLGGKMSPEAIAARFNQSSGVSWQQAMQVADHNAPRVGTLVIDAGELIQVVQRLCPEKKIHHVVLCRGTDRYVGPNKSMLPGLAPLRRQICIRRHSTEIHVDDWEPWERLSQRKLRRKGVPARVSMTVFAAPAQSPGVPKITNMIRSPTSLQKITIMITTMM